jgi:3-oxoacyl-[acyl-carrier-protein] synthase II
VVVTGLGAVTPLAHSAAETWQRLLCGESGVRPIEKFDAEALPVRIAGEVHGVNVREWVDSKTARQMAPFVQFAVAAAGMALTDAGLDEYDVDPERAAVVVGTATGGVTTILDAQATTAEHGLMRISPFFLVTFPANLAAYHIAKTFRLLGPNLTVSTACATGSQAIAEGARVIRSGEAELALVGGAEESCFPLIIASFAVQRALSTRNDHPAGASRPFDAERDGFVLAEGAAMLVIEELGHARARGAPIYAELRGAGSSNDGYHLIMPDPSGAGATRAMQAAMADAGVTPEDVDYINAHAAGTPLGDQAETLAIRTVLGEHAETVPVSSTKSMLGHMMGAAGAVEAMATVLALREQIIPPTINYETPDPACDLDYVPNVARPAALRVALSNSFGVGGQNACLVFSTLADEAF